MSARCPNCQGAGRVIQASKDPNQIGSRYVRCGTCSGRGHPFRHARRFQLEEGDTLVWDVSARRLLKKADGTVWMEVIKPNIGGWARFRMEWVAVPKKVWTFENARRKKLGWANDSEEGTPASPRKDTP